MVPTVLPRTAMRLSEAVFGDFPLTPHKVRTEQEQKAGQKHFRRHSSSRQRGLLLGEANAMNRKETQAWGRYWPEETGRARTGRQNHYTAFTNNQLKEHVCKHTHNPHNETQKHLECHLIAARRTSRARAHSRTLIFQTPTHSMVRIWAGVSRVSPSFTHNAGLDTFSCSITQVVTTRKHCVSHFKLIPNMQSVHHVG